MSTDSSQASIPLKFVISAVSGVGALLVAYPFELLKNRMQVSGEAGQPRDHKTVFHFGKHILTNEGFFGLYRGFSAGALRQVIYTGTRMGSFQAAMDYLTEKRGKPPNVFEKAYIGMVTGALGASVGLPTDVAMIRMAVDNRLPPEKRRNYKGVFDALIRIYREEGPLTWFRGFTPTLCRAVVLNASILTSYMECKNFIRRHDLIRDGSALHGVSSAFAALVSSICSLPFDIVKTRLQNMKTTNGKPQYSGFFDVWRVIITKEGFFSLWKGFTPYYVKNGPQTIIFFVIYEKMFRLYNVYKSQ